MGVSVQIDLVPNHEILIRTLLLFHKFQGYSLCCVEGEGEVVPPVSRVQLVEVEGLWVEVVDERAKRNAVVPTRREVGHVHILEEELNSCGGLNSFWDPPIHV